MKKIIIVILVIAIGMLFSSCNEKNTDIGQVQNNSTSSNTDLVENNSTSSNTETTASQDVPATDEVKVIISPPSDWDAFESAGIIASYSKGTASFIIKEEPYFDGKTLDDVVEEAKDIFSNSSNDTKFAEAVSVKIATIDGKKLPFTCVLSNMTMKYEFIYLFVDGDVYAITMGDLEETFDEHIDEFNEILESIQFE